jgi:hypothetical protein
VDRLSFDEPVRRSGSHEDEDEAQGSNDNYWGPPTDTTTS